MKKFIRRTELAKSLGLKPGTLARMDREGRGPAGGFFVSQTCKVYPADEVEKWLRERRLSWPAFDTPPHPAENVENPTPGKGTP